MTASDRVSQDFAPGEASGLSIPAHPEALRRAGAAFLTAAFRTYGALPVDAAVARITHCEPFAAGNSGQKLLLSVAYEGPDTGLPEELFVKFSRELTDAFRDRRRHEMAAEVRLAALSRLPAFPVPVARALFADFDPASGTGILITERIAFGQGGIEPLRAKNMDHQLARPEEYYGATVAALARLAAAHQSGRLSPEVERLFPFDRAAAEAEMPIPWDARQLAEKLAAIGDLARRAPQLLPAGTADGAFLARLADEAQAVLARETQLRHFLYADPRLIALSHWNTHIDNAWFWRDADGAMRCGLLDWGMVRPMNLAIALWGGLSGARPAMLEHHLDALLARFVRVHREAGGPAIGEAEIGRHFDLAVALIGLALLMDAPALLLSRMPDLAELDGVDDPRLARDTVVQGFLHTFAAFLAVWRQRDFAASLAGL